jgi:hypothetical protein
MINSVAVMHGRSGCASSGDRILGWIEGWQGCAKRFIGTRNIAIQEIKGNYV